MQQIIWKNVLLNVQIEFEESRINFYFTTEELTIYQSKK